MLHFGFVFLMRRLVERSGVDPGTLIEAVFIVALLDIGSLAHRADVVVRRRLTARVFGRQPGPRTAHRT